jgi:hypothetical protein
MWIPRAPYLRFSCDLGAGFAPSSCSLFSVAPRRKEVLVPEAVVVPLMSKIASRLESSRCLPHLPIQFT